MLIITSKIIVQFCSYKNMKTKFANFIFLITLLSMHSLNSANIRMAEPSGPLATLSSAGIPTDIQNIIVSYLDSYKLNFDVENLKTATKLLTILAKNKLASYSTSSNSITIWDLETGELINNLKTGFVYKIIKMISLHDGTIAAYDDGNKVYVWGIYSSEPIQTISIDSKIYDLIGHRFNYLITLSRYVTQIWDLENKYTVRDKASDLLNSTRKIDGIWPDNTIGILLSDDKIALAGQAIRVKDIDSGEILNSFWPSSWADSVTCLAYCEESKLLAIGTNNKNVRLCSFNGYFDKTWPGHTSKVKKIVILTKNKITSQSDNEIIIWNKKKEIKEIFKPKETDKFDELVKLNDQEIGTIYNNYHLMIYNINTNTYHTLDFKDFISAIAADEIGNLIIGLYNGKLHFYKNQKQELELA